MKIRIVALALMLLVAINLSCLAQSSVRDLKISQCVKGKNLEDTVLTDLQRLILTIIAEEDRSRKWSLALTGSYNRDDAGVQTKSTLASSIAFKKGEYPRQFRFNINTRVLYQEGNLEENVTSYLLNYDYYMRPKFEVYGFVERFTDTYLSIDHRFEIGFGIKREWQLWGFIEE
jgi:hypothetical protein